MYYLELIERFWLFNKTAKLSAAEVMLYLYLLKTGFENDRYDFKMSDSAIASELGLTQKTVKSTKEKLKKSGIIQFQTSVGRPCSYRLLLHYTIGIKTDKKRNKKVSKKENHPELNVKEAVQENGVPDAANSNTPSWEEFIEYAETLENYTQALDSNIRIKYEGWIQNNWKNALGRPITNWKATLKSAIPYMRDGNTEKSISVDNIPDIKRPEV
ncbi:hypothetical protein [Chryseobacterium terrae]|uniref:Helix-turn-helix domain-containing protein n=1 Tax=Chryseobacterium terrae TaxID=3163299 RepID=A0ABW8Y8E3_9FLAO